MLEQRQATGSILFDGSDVGLSGEDWDALTLKGSATAAPVNEAPTSTSSSVSFTEDTTTSITLSGTDPDGTVAEISVRSLPSNGTLYTDSALTDQVFAGASYATTGESLTLFFVPDADVNDNTSFQFAAIDDQGRESSTRGVINLEGTPVNDAPVVDVTTPNPNFADITEDDINNDGNTVGFLLTQLVDPDTGENLITDVDGDDIGIAVVVNNGNGGTWQYSIDDGATWLDVGAVSNESALLLRDTDLLRLNPDGEQGNNANIGFRAWDQSDALDRGDFC